LILACLIPFLACCLLVAKQTNQEEEEERLVLLPSPAGWQAGRLHEPVGAVHAAQREGEPRRAVKLLLLLLLLVVVVLLLP
jgi:hypothetical protein